MVLPTGGTLPVGLCWAGTGMVLPTGGTLPVGLCRAGTGMVLPIGGIEPVGYWSGCTGAVPPWGAVTGLIGCVTPLGATGPVSSGRARRVMRTVSFFNGTVDVFFDGLPCSGGMGAESLMFNHYKKSCNLYLGRKMGLLSIPYSNFCTIHPKGGLLNFAES